MPSGAGETGRDGDGVGPANGHVLARGDLDVCITSQVGVDIDGRGPGGRADLGDELRAGRRRHHLPRSEPEGEEREARGLGIEYHLANGGDNGTDVSEGWHERDVRTDEMF